MARNKLHLQLALYARPRHPDTFHYAILITPKPGSGQPGQTKRRSASCTLSATKFHVKNTLQISFDGTASQPWRFEKTILPDLSLDPRLLVCITIGKIPVASLRRVEEVLGKVPIDEVDDIDEADVKSFSCLTWVVAALRDLCGLGCVVGLAGWDWHSIQREAVHFVEEKKRSGMWDSGRDLQAGSVPVMDLLAGKEIDLSGRIVTTSGSRPPGKELLEGQ